MHPILAYELARTLMEEQQRAAAGRDRSRRGQTRALEAERPARQRMFARAILRGLRAG